MDQTGRFTIAYRTLLRHGWKPGLMLLLLALCLLFVLREGPQLATALQLIPQTPAWVAGAATLISGLYLLLNGLMYVYGFRAAGARLPVSEACMLWLRRNFLSVFLPAGGVTSMGFYNRSLRRDSPDRPALSDQQIYAGALVYLVAGYGSLILVALPVLALGVGNGLMGNTVGSVLSLIGLMSGAYAFWTSFRQRGWIYRMGQRYAPSLLNTLDPLRTQSLNRTDVLKAIWASVGIELCGIAHVALATWAVGKPVTASLALTGYVVATLFYALSPVLRGVGAVETSLTLVLTQLAGLSLPMALAATIYYRLFEFWLPLVIGLFSFIGQRSNLVLRVLPVFLTFLLGITNILSALTPGLADRLRFLEGLLPTSVMTISNYAVIVIGLLLIGLSIGLLRGYRLAWTIIVGLVGLSMLLHLIKAFDFEEAIAAAVVLLVLLYTEPNYRLEAPPLRRLTRLPRGRQPVSIALSTTSEAVRQLARQLIEQTGRSPLDYFKVYTDKDISYWEDLPAFIAYRVSGRYAVVLEGPVCAPEHVVPAIQRFDALCHQNGCQSIYYRVDTDDLPSFSSLGKKSLMIGQEGLVDVAAFSLDGRDRKALRNALRHVQAAGYTTRVSQPPQRDGLVQQLQAVSDEWLRREGLHETAFSQGVFRSEEIKHQPVIYLENPSGKVMAFINIIPDYAPNEGTYDLIRKTNDAPSGVNDVLLVTLIQYGQEKGWHLLNLGLAPFSGLDEAQTVPEQAMKLAYERIRAFDHFKGLRAYKEKYADVWRNKYLVYNEDLDLLQASLAIQRVAQYQPPQSSHA